MQTDWYSTHIGPSEINVNTDTATPNCANVGAVKLTLPLKFFNTEMKPALRPRLMTAKRRTMEKRATRVVQSQAMFSECCALEG